LEWVANERDRAFVPLDGGEDLNFPAFITLNWKWLWEKTSLDTWWIHAAATNTLDWQAEQGKPNFRIPLFDVSPYETPFYRSGKRNS